MPQEDRRQIKRWKAIRRYARQVQKNWPQNLNGKSVK
jgi:hypothetical protein